LIYYVVVYLFIYLLSLFIYLRIYLQSLFIAVIMYRSCVKRRSLWRMVKLGWARRGTANSIDCHNKTSF